MMAVQVYAYSISKLVQVVTNKNVYDLSCKGRSMYSIKGTSEKIVASILNTSLTETKTRRSILKFVVVFMTF